MLLLYYSSRSGNTEHFVNRLGFKSKRITEGLVVDEPFILFVPTYARPDGAKAVHKTVIDFLKNHRSLIKGVIGSGNINFGRNYAISADIISNKCSVPILHKYELRGTDVDVDIVRKKIIDANNRL